MGLSRLCCADKMNGWAVDRRHCLFLISADISRIGRDSEMIASKSNDRLSKLLPDWIIENRPWYSMMLNLAIDGDRNAILRELQHNDPNGCYTDRLCYSEFRKIMSEDDAIWQVAHEVLSQARDLNGDIVSFIRSGVFDSFYGDASIGG